MKAFVPMVLAASLLAAPCVAQDASRGDVPRQPTVNLSLDQAIVWALQFNLDIEIQSYVPDLRASQVEEARSRFDPIYSADFTAARTDSQATVALTGERTAQNEVYDFGHSIRRTMPTGGTWTVRMAGRNTVTNANESVTGVNDRLWTSTSSLTLTQPVLRNFGFRFNRSTIHIAENSLDRSYYEFQQQVQNTVQQVVTAYWNLQLSADILKIQLDSLDRVRTSLALTNLLIENGKLAKHERYEVETNLSNQLDQVHQAQKSFMDAEDALKRLIAPENEEFIWNSHLELATRPTIAAPQRTMEDSTKTALEIRPEIHVLRLNIVNADEAILQARNQMLPQLNFTGTIAQSDTVGHVSFDETMSTQFSDNDYGAGWGMNWSAGVVFEVPLGNRPARSAYTSRVIERRQAEASLRNTESQIVQAVREAVRDVFTTLERVDVTTKGSEAALLRYQSEETLFKEGQTDNFRLQQFRQNLLQAQLQEVRARSEHAISHIDLDRAEGTILRRLRDRNIIVKGVEVEK